MKFQAIATIAMLAIPAVFASPVPTRLSTRSDVEVTVELMSDAISTFQTLVQEALTLPVDDTPTNTTTSDVSKRSYTAELEEINAIFADIQRVAEGSAPLPSPGGHISRRTSVSDVVKKIVDYLSKLISKSNLKRSVPEGDDALAAAIALVHGWADGTIPLPGDDGSVVVSEAFTADDALELATLLKDVIVAWRAQYDASLGSGTALEGRSAQSIEVAPYFSDVVFDKRGRLGLKLALKALAAAIDAFADTL